MQDKQRKWQSLHIFYHAFDRVEPLLVDVIQPMLTRLQKEDQLQQWFFIRYWEGGPHLRLRMLNLSEQAQSDLQEVISRYMSAYPPKHTLTKAAYYKDHKLDGQKIPFDELPWYENGSIIPIAYIPELGRYGGAAAMSSNEALFYSSSKLAMKIVELTIAERQKRISLAFDLMLITSRMFQIQPEYLSRYFSNYSRYWEGFVDSTEELQQGIQQAFEKQKAILEKRRAAVMAMTQTEGEGLEHPLYQPWMEAIKNETMSLKKLGREQLLEAPFTGGIAQGEVEIQQALEAICFSHMHMTNNRLGIYPLEEFYLGKWLALLTENDVLKEV